MSTEAALMTRLRERQAELSETDAAFAARMDISRQMWQAMRTGRLAPGVATLRRIATAFPELSYEVGRFSLSA